MSTTAMSVTTPMSTGRQRLPLHTLPLCEMEPSWSLAEAHPAIHAKLMSKTAIRSMPSSFVGARKPLKIIF
ncbi:MAG: hypothetical protein Q7N87_01520 [Candidatus Uhrbacteria bacterium]|nr:hypothetical protein [Candidatus Uhrbacteria bacterium]